MKLNSLRLTAVLAAVISTLGAAPLAETTAVHTKPDAASPAVAFLKAGTEPVVATDTTAPAGWLAVTLAGPHEVYAANKDINKALDVRPGSPYRTAPKPDAPILALAAAGDSAEITGLHGKWTQLKLSKPVVGYIQSNSRPAAAAPKAAAPAPVAAPAVTVTPVTTAEAPAAAAIVVPGKAAPTGDGGSSALPRLFQGKLVSTYSAFHPRRPYDFQLNDSAGVRYAYLDVSKLLATEQISSYLDRTVVVYGTAKAVPNSKDMVIEVESLQLR
jgi:hypothetical protein